MAKKIVVAGAGHGGLVAAALLAKKGYEVTVLEGSREGSVGYDWADIFDVALLEEYGFSLSSNFKLEQINSITFLNPRKTVQTTIMNEESSMVRIERRELCRYLIEHAQNCGATIVYESNVIGPKIHNNKVIGVTVKERGKIITYFADLVIDAAGCDSPIRMKLPDVCGVEREPVSGQILYAYRALYERKGKMVPLNPFRIYFNNLNQKGVDRILTEGDDVDVFIGRFKPPTEEEIALILSDFKVDNPFLGKNVIRGGEIVKIPLRRTLSVMVADGYAAVGDSAFMTDPIMGYGINNSLYAGKILAQTIIENGSGKFDKQNLWSYQTRYFHELGSNMALMDKIKQFFLEIDGTDIDFLFENEVITKTDLANVNNGVFDIPFLDCLNKLFMSLQFPSIFTKLIKTILRCKRLEKTAQQIPLKYEERKVKKWAEKYLAL